MHQGEQSAQGTSSDQQPQPSPQLLLLPEGEKLMLGICETCTEERRARVSLEQRVRDGTATLEQANEELRRLAYIVSHDLRAPLVNLQGFVAELERAIAKVEPVAQEALPRLQQEQRAVTQNALSQDIPECLAFIRGATEEMEHLSRSLARLAELGQKHLSEELIDTVELIERILQSMRDEIGQKGIRVSVRTLPRVRTDRSALELILSSLIENAVQFLEPERPGEIEIWGLRQGATVVFNVRDNGRGMTLSHAEQAFDMFHRHGPKGTNGEGVGLAYVRTMVRRCGGRVWCESELGKGSTFRIALPLPATPMLQQEKL